LEPADLTKSFTVEIEALPVTTLNGTYSLKSNASKQGKKKNKREKKKTKNDILAAGNF
jgi:hypothetical protein